MSRRRASAAALVAAVLAFGSLFSVSLRAASESPAPTFDLGQTGKVHPELYRLARGDAVVDPAADTWQRPDPGADPSHVTVSAVPASNGPELLTDLEQIGLANGAATEDLVTGRLPIEAIDAAGELDSLRFIRPEWSIASTGGVNTQGDQTMKADVARSALAVTGAGVTVGTLSDSFDCEHGYATDLRTGELPAGIEVLAEGPCADQDQPPTDEGRAMMQIIADVAPGSTQKFHTARNGQLDYAKGIVELKAAGAKVINDDFAYLAEPWFHDGVIAQAIDAVTAEGVSYFTAAGNAGRVGYESPYREGSFQPKGFAPVPAHDFDPGAGVDGAQRVLVPPFSIARIALQWDDNFKTQIPSADAPETDLDIGAFASDGTLLPLPGLPGSDGGLSAFPSGLSQAVTLEPVEIMVLVNPTSDPQPADLVIIRSSGPPPPLLKWIGVSLKPVTVIDFPSAGTGSIFGHAQALGALTVGAASALQATSPPVVEPLSSVGGGRITRNEKGETIGTSVIRLRPNFVAPDNVNTSFFGEDSPDDADRFPNFLGTSAAAPHAAAVAALALERAPTATRDDICNAMSSTAVDMGTVAGPDDDSGHGYIDANAALAALPLTSTTTSSPRCKTVSLAIDSVNKKEGSAGATVFQFKVSRLGRSTADVIVDYATADGTAKEATDYKKANGTLTFKPTDVSKTIDVEVTGDKDVEPDEMFDLTIKLAEPVPTNVLLTNTFGTATIDDDDDPATITDPAASVLNYVSFGEASPDRAEPGDTVKIEGQNFRADADLDLTLNGTPISLGSVKSSTTGTFSHSVTIPDGAVNGRQTIEAKGANATTGTRTIRYPITIVNGASASNGGLSTGTSGGSGLSGSVITESVGTTTTLGSVGTTTVGAVPSSASSPTSLPRTGANVTFFAQLGALLVLIGLAAVYGSRRRGAETR